MADVRRVQAEDVRDALRRLGPATAERLGEETVLSVWSVKCRLKERPEWFRPRPDGWWELVEG